MVSSNLSFICHFDCFSAIRFFPRVKVVCFTLILSFLFHALVSFGGMFDAMSLFSVVGSMSMLMSMGSLQLMVEPCLEMAIGSSLSS